MLNLVPGDGLANMTIRRLICFLVRIDEANSVATAIPGAPGHWIGKITGAHDTCAPRLGPVLLKVHQCVIVTIRRIVNDITGVEGAHWANLRRIREWDAGDQVRGWRGMGI